MNFGAVSAKLRKPFPREQIGKLPATQKRPALDFVGHAAVTDRLNDVCPDDWFYTVDELFMHGDQCWIRGTFTVGGVSRVEYGDGDDPKDAIGNFIRRGAMRFGVAIDLWSRQELSGPVEPTTTGVGGMAGPDDRALAYGEGASDQDRAGEAGTPSSSARALSSQVRSLLRLAQELRWNDEQIVQAIHEAFPAVGSLKELSQAEARQLIPMWEGAARANRISDEQLATVKTLAALSDAKNVAEQMFGRKIQVHALTHAEGEELIEKLREIRVVS